MFGGLDGRRVQRAARVFLSASRAFPQTAADSARSIRSSRSRATSRRCVAASGPRAVPANGYEAPRCPQHHHRPRIPTRPGSAAGSGAGARSLVHLIRNAMPQLMLGASSATVGHQPHACRGMGTRDDEQGARQPGVLHTQPDGCSALTHPLEDDVESIRLQADEHPLIEDIPPANPAEHCLRLMHLRAYDEAVAYATGRDVLDVGCNTGYGTVRFAPVAGRVVGVDVSPRAIDAARRRSLDGRPEFVLTSGFELPFPDDSFDLVSSFQVLEHVPDPPVYLYEIARVARAGRHCEQGTVAPHAGVGEVAPALLRQTIGLADRRVEIDRQGPWRPDRRQRPTLGPAVAGSPDRADARGPSGKLRSKVPSVDAALSVKPRIRPVPPATRAPASSMQSPPASADMMSVRSLSPGLVQGCPRHRPGKRSRPAPRRQVATAEPGGGGSATVCRRERPHRRAPP